MLTSAWSSCSSSVQVLAYLFVAVINSMTESNSGRKGFVSFFTLWSIIKRSQDSRILEAGTKSETTEKHSY